MADWADQIKQATVEKQIQLHMDRFEKWNVFIQQCCTQFKSTAKTTVRVADPTNDFEKKLISKGADQIWSKKTILKNNSPIIVFDASFGSMDPTSDLDITVLALDTLVLVKWIEYVKTIHQKIKPMTFTRKYDSNFYFQQAVLNSGQLISKKKKEIQKLKPTKKSILKQTTLIENYAKAYIAKKSMQLGTFKVYPNPNSSEFNQQAEIIQMEATKHFANICQKDFSSDNVATLACCKTEGLISIGSLAICNVFGPDIRDQFKADAVDQPWRLLAAFEMLYNLKMHQNDNKIKTKYLERLDNILKNGPNSCKEQLRTQITKDILKIKASKDTKKK